MYFRLYVTENGYDRLASSAQTAKPAFLSLMAFKSYFSFQHKPSKHTQFISHIIFLFSDICAQLPCLCATFTSHPSDGTENLI